MQSFIITLLLLHYYINYYIIYYIIITIRVDFESSILPVLSHYHSPLSTMITSPSIGDCGAGGACASVQQRHVLDGAAN